MKDKLILLRTSALQYWQARNRREQLILMAGGSVLLVAIYATSLLAVQERIAALQRRLPELALNSYEIAAGKQGPAMPPPKRGEDLRSELFRILADQGVQAELRGLSADRVEMTMNARAGQNIINSLNAIRLTAGARVTSLQIRTVGAEEQAEASVILERRR